MGRFLLEVQPFTLLYTIFQEDTPIVFRLLLTNVTPLVKKFTSLLPAVNSRSFNWIKTRTVFQLALLGLKQTQMYRFPYPFIYLVPQKRYLFRAELPPIGHHGEYPRRGFQTIHANALLWMFILFMLSISPCWKSRWIIYCSFFNPKNNRQQFRFH